MSPALDYDTHRMTKTDDGKTQAESRRLHSNYFYCEHTDMTPIDPYIDAFENIYTLPTFINATNHNIALPSDSWSTEAAAAAFNLQFPNATYSPPIAPLYTSVPSNTSSNENIPIDVGGWQIEADYLLQTSPGVPWEYAAWSDSASHNNTMPASRVLRTGISNMRDPKANSEFSLNTATIETGSPHENCADPLQHSPQRKRKKCDDTESSEKTSSKSEVSGRTFPPVCTTYSSKTPMSDASFDPPDTEETTNTRPSRSATKTGSSNETPQMIHSPPATPRPGRRARNRTAAIKCRIKTKAAIAELEATERAVSSRHEQLCVTLRGLQADVFALKSEILLHCDCGDGHIQDYLNNAAKSLANG